MVRAGLVKSLSKPEGNATGFTLLTNDLEPKRLGLLHDLLPKADVVGVLYDPNFPPAVDQLAAIEKAAETIALRVDVLRAGNDDDLNAGLQSLRNHRVSALLLRLPHTLTPEEAELSSSPQKIRFRPSINFVSTRLTAALSVTAPVLRNPIGRPAFTWVGFSMVPSRAICLSSNRRTSIS